MRCPYCNEETIIKPSTYVYNGRDYGHNVLVCINYPMCDAFVGCHKGTEIPLGRLADSKLRKAKMAAHAHFDPIWKNKEMKRKQAYKWLAEQMEIHPNECHIGLFNENKCDKVIEICLSREVNNEVI